MAHSLFDVSLSPVVTPMLNFKATAYAIIGEPLELPCTFTGDVPDNFVWISPDNSENRSQALYFPDVTESTSGIYTCNISGFGVETSLLDTLLVYSDSRSVNLIAQSKTMCMLICFSISLFYSIRASK